MYLGDQDKLDCSFYDVYD